MADTDKALQGALAYRERRAEYHAEKALRAYRKGDYDTYALEIKRADRWRQ